MPAATFAGVGQRMEMTGHYQIPASREKVWAALNHPVVPRARIPGREDLEKLSDTEMTATVKAKVGPVSATFKGNVTLSNLDPPNGYTITGESKAAPLASPRAVPTCRWPTMMARRCSPTPSTPRSAASSPRSAPA